MTTTRTPHEQIIRQRQIVSDFFDGDLTEANRQRPGLLSEFRNWDDVQALIFNAPRNSAWGQLQELFNT